MANGAGKYDDICTQARESAQAHSAVVIILGGKQGHGFSVQTVNEDLARVLPKILRDTAAQIEDDNKKRSA